MGKKEVIKIFEEKKVRTVWDDVEEKWYFSIVDVCGVLTESPNPRNYWKVLKHRLVKEGNETVTNCNQLKLRAEDGKMRLAEASATEISKKENPKGYGQNADVAKRGGHVAKAARNQLESQLGRSVVTSLNAKDYFKSLEQEEEQKTIENKKRGPKK